MKRCVACRELLPYAAFGASPRGGYHARCQICLARQRARGRHGLVPAEKRALAEAQDGCAICGRSDPGAKGWTVDHDRACCPKERSCYDCRRAILCHWCNTALGYAMDNPEVLRRMADFLELGTRLGIATRSTEGVV